MNYNDVVWSSEQPLFRAPAEISQHRQLRWAVIHTRILLGLRRKTVVSMRFLAAQVVDPVAAVMGPVKESRNLAPWISEASRRTAAREAHGNNP
jgi:hypothetical protein